MQTVNPDAPIELADDIFAQAQAAILCGFQRERLLMERAERRLKEHALTQQRVFLALIVALSLVGIGLAVCAPPLLGRAVASGGGWALAITALLRARP